MGSWGRRIIGLAIAAYFLYFARGAVRAHFAVDDPMNLGIYWRRGLGTSLADTVMLWRASYRPMGAAFYLPIYHFFGMNPLPYRIAVLALLALNIFLSWRIAMMLTESIAAAALVAVLVTAHASMGPIYYNTSMIYDVLAFFFTALMLWMYMRWRGNAIAGVLVVLAYLAAINSKEIAVVGAAWVVAYEVFIGRPRRWVVPGVLTAIGIAFTASRALGPNSLSKQDGYQLQITAHRFFVNARIYLNDFFYTTWFSNSRRVVMVWALATIFTALVRRRELWWAWFLMSTATLPVIFTVQPRAGGSLYLPLLALSLWMAAAATILLVKWPIRQWAAAALVSLLMVPATLGYWNERAAWLLRDQELTWTVLQQIRELPRPAPGTRILILRNPFRDWDTYFLATLVWNDHTLDVNLLDHMDPKQDPSHFDWVLDFEGTRLKVVKGAGIR